MAAVTRDEVFQIGEDGEGRFHGGSVAGSSSTRYWSGPVTYEANDVAGSVRPADGAHVDVGDRAGVKIHVQGRPNHRPSLRTAYKARRLVCLL
jgi:hypothetical protein